MGAPSKKRKLEKQYGKPMRILLAETANDLGELQNVAAAWGVHITTLTRWQDEEGVTRVWKAGPKPKTTNDVN